MREPITIGSIGRGVFLLHLSVYIQVMVARIYPHVWRRIGSIRVWNVVDFPHSIGMVRRNDGLAKECWSFHDGLVNSFDTRRLQGLALFGCGRRDISHTWR